YHIDGTLTALGADPVHSAGDQTSSPSQTAQATDLTNISFALIDDNGAAHQLQVLTQTAQRWQGNATFTAVWDGQNVEGTLTHDNAGNVHITFSGDTGSFDGTLAGAAGAYQIDGNFMAPDGTMLHAAGAQTA